MPYFAVDDQLTFHPKAVAAGNAAMGAWTRAGAWAKNHATGGFVSLEVAHAIGAKESKRLVDVGLWETGSHPEFGAGYWFHDWDHMAGNADGQTEKDRRDAKREADRIRQRQKRESAKESRATSPRLSLPSVPVPSPDETDDGNPSPYVTEVDAGEADETEFVRELAEKAGIRDLPRVRVALERAVGSPLPSDAHAIDLAQAVLGLSKTHVKSAEAYIEKAALNSPGEIRDRWAAVLAVIA